MVKWISCPASNRPFQVRVLAGAQELIFLFMNKILLVFLASFAFLFLFSGSAYAKQCGSYPNPFLVGPPAPSTSLHPETDGSLVPCGQYTNCRCELADIFEMIRRVFLFITAYIAAPLAGLFIVVGGILIMLSGFNANWYPLGKRFIIWSFVSFLLIFGSFLIVDFVLKAIGYNPPGGWNTIF